MVESYRSGSNDDDHSRCDNYSSILHWDDEAGGHHVCWCDDDNDDLVCSSVHRPTASDGADEAVPARVLRFQRGPEDAGADRVDGSALL